ncbi:siderophore-interacting protein [Corynebacterium parakroppenstedtii]|uniref:siderophore-interacting protein n=2 Tax=Corynebacteriaceae TaxID=1653 RepID=UPI000619D640|nr:Siderophore-interacting FAD-binding domain protein [Corynebacterium kroppenstedtii]PMC66765.1 hypothetical protein CJ202_03645 [Corynebacterium kroppenstedtii]
MGKGFQGAILRLMGVEEHYAHVIGKSPITDSMLQIDFVCPNLLEEGGEAPSSWVRAWFPDPDGGNRLFQRAYTLINTYPEQGKFSLAFLIHDPAGPAAIWAQQAQIGDELTIQRMGGRLHPQRAKSRRLPLSR